MLCNSRSVIKTSEKENYLIDERKRFSLQNELFFNPIYVLECCDEL